LDLSSNEESTYDKLLRKYSKYYMYSRASKEKLEQDIARLVKEGKSREQAINELAIGELIEPSPSSEAERKKPGFSVDYLHERIADARAKENISWIGALAGAIVLVVGIALSFYNERSIWSGQITHPYSQVGVLMVVIGFLILFLAGASARDRKEEKEKYLKELEKSHVLRNVCPNCGREMSPDFKMCPYCGTKL